MNARFLAMKAAAYPGMNSICRAAVESVNMPAAATTLPHTPAPADEATPTPEFVSPPASVSLETRVAALELKAQYDGEFIAKLSRQLEQAGEVIDALTARVHRLSETLRPGLSTPGACQRPGTG